MANLSFSELEGKPVLPDVKTTATGGEPHKMEGGKRKKKGKKTAKKTGKKGKKTAKKSGKKGKKTAKKGVISSFLKMFK